MELLYKADNIEIYHCSDDHALYCNWIGFQPKELLTDAASMILMQLKQKAVTKVLNSNVRVEGAWIDSADWIAQSWFPAMAQSGLQHFAWILSPNIFAKLSAQRAMPLIEQLNVQLFDGCNYTISDAVNWLQRYPNSRIIKGR